ncbi:Bgt-1150 [Blumeria graminis f. sp. tritici]|uniref:Chitobiosyldiphosphodolichol beta-mannosyltransferase n=2 Tax=Blumeria graminis f. sp. tritici TaxID=62690 RepID=A0A9X9QBM8_BLUGR|nr:Mannosyltransferase [Blumeria graminis f. sp. tritici 96224]VDB83608.1 Bgt-1150 [Blumeria graminis f. sp. tritici]
MSDVLVSVALIVSTTITVLFLLAPSRYVHQSHHRASRKASSNTPEISVQVLVLGDIGRSPRMQYHAMSIAKHGGQVEIIGYLDSTVHPELVASPRVTIIPIPQPPRALGFSWIPFVIAGPLKVLWQLFVLSYALSYRTKPTRWLLVQNPPAIPTLLIALFICFVRNTHLIIDWHNYGWSILAGTKGPKHPFVQMHKYYESTLGNWAPTANFTVSDAMRRQLKSPPYNICTPILTLHDRPPDIFQPIECIEARKAFLKHLPETATHAQDIISGDTKLLVSSTSWTPDEDLNLLLEALCSYAASQRQLPSVLVVITGKGPQKQDYIDRIKILTSTGKLQNITIRTAWFSIESYASLLSVADLGVCLHMSSSGVDLPMKVVDMFGAGLPVVGYDAYESWQELVREGENGRGFHTSEALSSILQELFSEKDGSQLAALRRGALEEGKKRWDDTWNEVAGRVMGLCD